MGYVGIVDFKSNNASSVLNVVASLGYEAKLVKNVFEIENSAHLIIPGVGHIDSLVTEMDQLNLRECLTTYAISGKSVLGICLGQHLLGRRSEESLNVKTLGVLDFEVNTLPANLEIGLRVPHVGWNSVEIDKENTIFQGIPDQSDFYFSHSYGITKKCNATLASTEHSIRFTSVACVDNVYGVQFHPEKSQKVGRKLLENFCRL